MEINGKVYRNLEGQVGYLTAKLQELANEIDEMRAQIPSKMIVEELPETGDPLITYYVGPKGTAPNQYYEVWIWVQEEEDGPFVWRELEDTDQVDLSGYLQKVETETSNAQVYVKTARGSQTMYDLAQSVVAGAIPLRGSSGQILVPEGTPTSDSAAPSKGYVVNNFLAKKTVATTYAQAYVKNADGTQGFTDIAVYTAPDTIVKRDGGGGIRGRSIAPSDTSDLVTNKGYVDTYFLAKQTGSTSYSQVYTKNADGTQGMANIANGGTTPYTIVQRDGGGRITCATPQSGNDAANKDYVDATVGQLLYLHDIEIIVTVDATNKLYIKAYLINGSSTAITLIDRPIFKRMEVEYGAFGPNIENANACAVIKCPDTFRQDTFDEPYPAYMYLYMSGGVLQANTTTNSMAVTVTDTVISF